MVDRHTVAQHAADQLGIVPVFGIEFLRKSLHGGLIATLVLKLEVVALRAVGILLLDNLSLGHRLRQYDTFVIILQTSEYLIGIAVEQSHEGHPFLLVVLEAHHVALQCLWTNLRHFGMLAGHGLFLVIVIVNVSVSVIALLFLLFVHLDHHTRARAVTINCAALTATSPSFHVQAIYQCLIHIVRQVHRHGYRMVHPFLDGALHLHLHQPVHIVGGSLAVR